MTSKASKHAKAHRRNVWFKRIRGSYIPVSTQGWLTYIPFSAYLILSFIIGYTETSSYTLAVFFIVPNWVAAASVMTWIASQKS